MRIAVVLAAAAAAVAALVTTPPSTEAAGAKTTIVRFQTPSQNMGCLFSSASRTQAYLRCDILSGVKPAPSGECELDWTGFSMEHRGRARPTCAGDTVYARGAPVVAYGRTWKRRGFRCNVRRVGLRCWNASGRGFFLSRARSYAF
jgi:hypothetical protein